MKSKPLSKYVDHHCLETLIDEFPSCKNDRHLGTRLLNDQINWSVGLARALKYEHVDDHNSFFSSAMKKYSVKEETQAILLRYYRRAKKSAKFPKNAPSLVADAVREFENSWGEIPACDWCTCIGTNTYSRLWLAVLMYGLHGYVFPFACNKMASAFEVSPGMIHSFLKQAEDEDFLQTVRKGRAYRRVETPGQTPPGTFGLYKIKNSKDYDLLMHVIPNPDARVSGNDLNKDMFWKYVRDKLPWLWDEYYWTENKIQPINP